MVMSRIKSLLHTGKPLAFIHPFFCHVVTHLDKQLMTYSESVQI